MSEQFDVVALGEAMVEFNHRLASEPLYRQGFGGDTSNAVIAASRQGARVAYLSRVGEDHFGRQDASAGCMSPASRRPYRPALATPYLPPSKPRVRRMAK